MSGNDTKVTQVAAKKIRKTTTTLNLYAVFFPVRYNTLYIVHSKEKENMYIFIYNLQVVSICYSPANTLNHAQCCQSGALASCSPLYNPTSYLQVFYRSYKKKNLK